MATVAAVTTGKPLPLPFRALPSPLRAEMSPRAALRVIASACLEHLQRNEAGAAAGENPEFVHQARVAIRRLRMALRLFSSELPPNFSHAYSAHWRSLASSMGERRDADVFLTETLLPLEAAFPCDADLIQLRMVAETMREQAQQEVRAALSGPDYHRLRLDFAEDLSRLDADWPAQETLLKPTLHEFACQGLERSACRVEQLVSEHKKMNAERRHKMRIAFKNLRYSLDFLAPLFSPRRLSRYRAALAGIQDRLGQLNDLETAARYNKEIQPSGGSGLVLGWITGQSALLTDALTPSLKQFIRLRQPWR